MVYSRNDNNIFSLNYSKRINRPSYNSLNPFRWYSSPYSYSEGNPFLEPYVTHNIELTHLFKNNLSTNIYFTTKKNKYSKITLIDKNTEVRVTVVQNLINESTIGVYQSFALSEIKWLKSYLEYDLNYNEVDYNSLSLVSNNRNFNLKNSPMLASGVAHSYHYNWRYY